MGDRLGYQNWPMRCLLSVDEELEILEYTLLRLHGTFATSLVTSLVAE